MFSQYWLILLVLTPVATGAVKTGKLTAGAAITGWLLGLLVFTKVGYTGVAMMAVFFLLATIATSIGLATKQSLEIAEREKGKRTASQVIANAGVAGILSILIWLYPTYAVLLQLMVAASFASATADTVSSELGNVYGRKFYNILTFKKDKRGLDGVVSLEGTLFGVLGSALIAVVFAIGIGWNLQFFLIVIFAGTLGNLADSVLGATLEREKYLNNNAVNFLNTGIGALAALLLFYLV